jgi:hypothetical protein
MASVRITAMAAVLGSLGGSSASVTTPQNTLRPPSDIARVAPLGGCPPPTMHACPHDARPGRRGSADGVPPQTVDETGQRGGSP